MTNLACLGQSRVLSGRKRQRESRRRTRSGSLMIRGPRRDAGFQLESGKSKSRAQPKEPAPLGSFGTGARVKKVTENVHFLFQGSGLGLSSKCQRYEMHIYGTY